MSEKTHTDTNEFSPQGFPAVPSLYSETLRSLNYSDRDDDGNYVHDNARLREVGNFWALRRHDPETSPRALGEIERLVGRISFELVMRQQELADE